MEKVLTGDLTFRSLVPCDLSTCTKSDILAYFENSYNLNESLFTALKDESVFYKCPDRLRLPLIFYYGHTACVYMNKLILAGLLKPEDRVNLQYETMFETGVDEMSWDDTENYRMGGQIKWPRLDNVIEYRRKVRDIIVDLIDKTPLELPVTMDSPWWGLFMGMDHERIHIETSSVLIHQLPVDLLVCPPKWNYAPSTSGGNGAGENAMIAVDAQEVTLGKPKDFPSFGWDNEYGNYTCNVPAFEASQYPISNREFLGFVEAGGYQNPDYWSTEGWKWAQFRQAKHPTFWVCEQGCKSGCGGDLGSHSHCKPIEHLTNGQNGYCNGHSVADDNGHQGHDEGGGHRDQYRLRVMFNVISMPWDWPVEVNYHEAKAYCAWKGDGYRLPCEAEVNVLRGNQKSPTEGTTSDICFKDQPSANLQLQFGSSSPVNYYPPNELGFYDLFGNVWEWAEDHFNGLPGFQTCPLYDDFSSPCFDGRHTVILGGSWISCATAASRFGRYAFRRHFFQHLGFRIVRSLDEDKINLPVRYINTEVFVLGDGPIEMSIGTDESCISSVHVSSTNKHYEWDSEDKLNQMLHQEYSTEDPHCMQHVQLAKTWAKDMGVPLGRALHMGCATGRTTVSLSKLFDETLAQDFSARFIDTCLQLQSGQSVKYSLEGVSKLTECYASFPQDNIPGNVTFKLMTWLPNEVGDFDFIYCPFFDRVQNVKSWTVRMPEILKDKGMVVIVSRDWDQHKLQPLFTNRFVLVKCADLKDDDSTVSHVTAWKHDPN